MTKGVKLIILLVLGILGIFLLLYFSLFRLRVSEKKISTEEQTRSASPVIKEENLIKGKDPDNSTTSEPTTTLIQVKSDDSESVSQDLARQVFTFVERFGSFSSESEYQNLEDLEIFMTDSMKQWAKQYRAQYARNTSLSSKVYRITTKALVVKQSEILEQEGKATFLITTKREEKEGSEKRTFYQNIEVKLVLIGTLWKIESAYWK